MSHEPVFYDCEASALDGVPIEVGWAFIDSDGLVVSAAYLIRPPRQWQIEARWDPAAEALHGIVIADLFANGRHTWQIAERMNAALAGCELFSDSPFDEPWFRSIFDDAGTEPRFTLRRMSADILIASRMDGLGLAPTSRDRILAEAERVAPRRHRAEDDARRLAMMWRLAGLAADCRN